MRYLVGWLLFSTFVAPLPSTALEHDADTAAVATPNVAQPDGMPILRWMRIASPRDVVEDDTIALGPGSWFRTEELFSDFVLRADFRLLEKRTDACLGVRAWTEFTPRDLGYCLSLGSRPPQRSAGTLVARGVSFTDVTFNAPAEVPLGTWQSVEVVVNRDALRGSFNGVQVVSATGLDEFTGYITIRALRGRLELRNISARLLNAPTLAFGAGVQRMGDPGVQAPRLVKRTKPRYPVAPHSAWKQGTVALEVIVEPSGRPGDAQITQSLHPSLNAAAIACVRQWRFEPARKEGKPVAVIVTIDISFTRTR